MSVELLAILIGVALIILATTDLISMDWFCGIALLLIAISALYPSNLKSEPIIEEYLRSSYETTIDEKEITNILNSYDKSAKLLDLKINEIPKSKSIYVEMKVRVGKYIYNKLDYKYTIGVDDDNVFIRKSDK